MAIKFPNNPSDGMIFEVSPSVYYQYSSSTNSWSKIFTAEPLALATPTNDGIMSSDDYIKLTNLRIPPPISTLTPVYTKTVTDADGNISLVDEVISGCQTFSKPIKIEPGDKFVIIDPDTENTHGATSVINFDIDTDELVRYLQSNGQWRSISPQGEKGITGPDGDPGLDALPVGPYGDDGVDGKPFWDGSLVEESIMIKTDGTKAIVNIKTKEVSPTENYLIVERGVIGNPFACPNTILPQDVQSPWILAIAPTVSQNADIAQFVSGPVGDNVPATSTFRKSGCGISNGTCLNTLFYFNIESVVQTIFIEWQRQLMLIKSAKELKVQNWLTTMSALFEQQKAALCCSLEAINSRKRNQQTRQYIESQAISALASNRTVTLSSIGSGAESLSTQYTLFNLADSDCSSSSSST